MAQINLLSLPSLDNTYQNVIDFSSISSQRSWFINKVGKQVEGNFRTDTEQQIIVLDATYQSIEPYDYIFFNDPSGKTLYYFITGKAIKTSQTCIIAIECDVWSTYLFDFEIKDSFVERCHVPRWDGDIPTMELVDEGLSPGDPSFDSYQTLYELNSSYYYASTVPLGYVKEGGWKPSGGGGSVFADGIPSASGYRFIKGYEGFGPSPYRVPGESADTAGYGIREDFQSEYFERLRPFPCSEFLAAEVYGDMLIDKFATQVWNTMKNDGLDMTKINQAHFDVWCSHAMNAGVGGWSSGTPYQMYKQGKPAQDIAEAIKIWAIKGENGEVLPGLIARRKAEATIFKIREYTYRPISIVSSSGQIVGSVTENGGHGYIPTKFKGDV